MRDEVTFELSYYLSGENEEWLPYGDTDYDFYIKYIEHYLSLMLSYQGKCIFSKKDLRKWVKSNTPDRPRYVRDFSECVGNITTRPNLDLISLLGYRYTGKPFNPLINPEIIYETVSFPHKDLNFPVCLFVKLSILEINNVAA